MKALENFAIDKENFESYLNINLDIKITDKQWLEIVDEIDGMVGNYIDELLERLAEQVAEGDFDE